MSKDIRVKYIYITIYTKEQGKLELTEKQWGEYDYDYDLVTFHRANGPAVEYKEGTKEWWLNNKLHRVDGPAVEHGFTEYKEWWIDNKRYSEKEFIQIIEEVKSLPLALRLTDPRWWVREMTFELLPK
jgi:hypothetical protein